MKPRKIKPVRAVNRISDSDRSYKVIKKRQSPQDSPSNNTNLNTTGDETEGDTNEVVVH
jgi:hypothetical protein